MSSKFAPHADRQAGELSGACLLRNKPEQGVPVNDVPALAAVFASETLFSVITLLRASACGAWQASETCCHCRSPWWPGSCPHRPAQP